MTSLLARIGPRRIASAGFAALGLTLVAYAMGCADGPPSEPSTAAGASPATAGSQASGQGQGPQGEGKRPGEGSDETPPKAKPKGPVEYTYDVVARYPHDRGAYTQGLLWHEGKLYESTGQRGESTVRLVDLTTGEVVLRRAISPRLFGEGLAAVNGIFYQLTWKAGQALLYSGEKLRPLSYDYKYRGDGWGLTTSPAGQLVMSDGTDEIQFMEPKGMKVTRRIRVRDQGRPVTQLNELEWIEGEIWANIWKSDRIARIDPETGHVTAWVDLTDLLQGVELAQPAEEVLNGIAWDAEGKRLFVTGKRWPYLFHIELREKP